MNYKYKSLSVPGGGFVTGFLFHPKTQGILYCRTDIGGVYRYDFEKDCWIALVDSIKDTEKWKTYPLAIALDAKYPERLYMSVGEHNESAIGYSEDYGDTFTYLKTPISPMGLPVEIHGNAPGRSTGERLLVDPYDSDTIYLGTMYDGLFVSHDRCITWKRLVVGDYDELNIAFIAVDEKAGPYKGRAKTLIVATSGEKGSRDGNIRGSSVYISHNGGSTFESLKGQPEAVLSGSLDHPGYVAQRIARDKRYMYITYSAYNIGWSNWNMYGCDTGKCYDGAVYRYEFNSLGQVVEALDITPAHPSVNHLDVDEQSGRRVGYGFSGISTDPSREGVVILSTITATPDVFYRSTDYGKTFVPIMSGLTIGAIDFKVPYQHPKYNGGHSLIHWMSDIKVNPFYPNMALFNTGAGVFVTYNLTAHEGGGTVLFETMDKGIEETVHLNVYAPSNHKGRIIDVIGDYGMFVFDSVMDDNKNTVADHHNNRWITAMNADFSDFDHQVIVATMRGNWTGLTKGGLVITTDSGKTYRKLPSPEAINEAIDEAVAALDRPNVTAGWCALSSDTKHIVWAIGLPLDGDLVVHTSDYGKSYNQSIFYNDEGKRIVFNKKPVKIFSDRIQSNRFFGFGDMADGPMFFVSDDYGAHFKQIKGPKDFPKVLLAGIDSEQHIEIRGVPKKAGSFYLALLDKGLWHLKYNEETKQMDGQCVSKPGDTIKRIGIGVDNHGGLNTLYTSGTISGVYGFYQSNDHGYRWTLLNDEAHQYGDIRSIDGDKYVPGRFYIATGTRGLIYGEPK